MECRDTSGGDSVEIHGCLGARASIAGRREWSCGDSTGPERVSGTPVATMVVCYNVGVILVRVVIPDQRSLKLSRLCRESAPAAGCSCLRRQESGVIAITPAIFRRKERLSGKASCYGCCLVQCRNYLGESEPCRRNFCQTCMRGDAPEGSLSPRPASRRTGTSARRRVGSGRSPYPLGVPQAACTGESTGSEPPTVQCPFFPPLQSSPHVGATAHDGPPCAWGSHPTAFIDDRHNRGPQVHWVLPRTLDYWPHSGRMGQNDSQIH